MVNLHPLQRGGRPRRHRLRVLVVKAEAQVVVQHIRLTPRVESACAFNSLKAHPFQSTSLSKHWFQTPTCPPTTSRSPDSSQLLTCGADKTCRLWDVAPDSEPKCVVKFTFAASTVDYMQVSE